MYSTKWFDPNIPAWKELLKKYKGNESHFLEVGCFEGRATTWLLKNILTHEKSSIIVIDTFDGSWEHKGMKLDLEKTFLENIEPYKEKVGAYRGESKYWLTKFNPGFDFIYIDGSHNAIDVLRDSVLSWDLLKKDGIMIFDDFTWGDTLAPELRPYPAIIAFLNIYQNMCTYKQINDQMIIWKH